MESIVPSFAQMPPGSTRNLYPGEIDQEETKAMLCCGGSAPVLSYKPVDALPFPYEALIEDLIEDLMKEKRNSDEQQYLASQNIDIPLPIPPYIPSNFTYIVEVITRVPNIRKIKVPQGNGVLVEKEEIGYPSIALASHKPYRWFVLSDENSFHALQIPKQLAKLRDDELADLVPAQRRRKISAILGTGIDRSRGASVQSTASNPLYEPVREVSDNVPVRLKKKRGLSSATEPDGFLLDMGPASKKAKLSYCFALPEMEKRAWVEIGQDDVSEKFDNTKRENRGGLVLKYRCGRVDCVDNGGTEWSFQVLKALTVRKSQTATSPPPRSNAHSSKPRDPTPASTPGPTLSQ